MLALTHRSWCAEHPGEASNERLEFLGDAVLGLIVTDHIVTVHPEMSEGDLAKLRSDVVCEASLAPVAEELGVGPALRLGRGEDRSGGRSKPSILADALEAILGAVHVDGGLEAARPVVLGLFADRLATASVDPGDSDHKTLLQELVAQQFAGVPVYRVRDEGPDHDKRFFAEVMVDERVLGRGEGRSKKAAEQRAAGEAVQALVPPEMASGSDRRRERAR